MIDIEIASLITRVLIGAGQIAVVLYGITRVTQANERRAQAGERQSLEFERRLAETMAALDMQRRALETLIQGMNRRGQALETLVTRTGEGRNA